MKGIGDTIASLASDPVNEVAVAGRCLNHSI